MFVKIKTILITFLFLFFPLIALSCSFQENSIQNRKTNRQNLYFQKEDDKFVYKTVTPKNKMMRSDELLTTDSYNYLYLKMKGFKNEVTVAIAIIANKKVYTDIVRINPSEPVWNILKRSDYEFRIKNHLTYGVFLLDFKPKNSKKFLHGTRKDKNYGRHYPFFYVNHKFLH